jgi:ribonuclease E
MRKSIGTSIRSAKRDLRRQEYYQQQRTNALHDQENINPDETDEGIENTIDTETTFNRAEDAIDEFEDVMNEDEDNDEDDKSDDGENEDDDEEMDNLMIEEELDEEDE